MPATPVAHAHLPGRLAAPAKQRVDKRGLARSGRPDQYRRPMIPCELDQRLDAVTGQRIHHDHVHTEGYVLHVAAEPPPGPGRDLPS